MERKDIKEMLEKQLKLLSEHNDGAKLQTEELCSLNKEICRTVEVFLKISDLQIGN